MKSVTRIVLALAVCAFVAPAFAGGDWTGQLRFGVSYFTATSNGTGALEYVDDPGYVYTHVKAKAKSSAGLYVGYEHKFSPLIGLEGYTGYYKPKFSLEDIDYGGSLFNSNEASATVIPLGVALNFHLVKSDKVDVYVGPTVAYLFYGKPKFTYDEGDNGLAGTLTVKLKNELAYGLVAGVDVQFPSKWNLAFRLSYLQAKADIDEIKDDWIYTGDGIETGTYYESLSEGFKPNPLTFTVGAGFKF